MAGMKGRKGVKGRRALRCWNEWYGGFQVAKEGWNGGRQFDWQEEYSGVRVEGRKVESVMREEEASTDITQNKPDFLRARKSVSVLVLLRFCWAAGEG